MTVLLILRDLQSMSSTTVCIPRSNPLTYVWNEEVDCVSLLYQAQTEFLISGVSRRERRAGGCLTGICDGSIH